MKPYLSECHFIYFIFFKYFFSLSVFHLVIIAGILICKRCKEEFTFRKKQIFGLYLYSNCGISLYKSILCRYILA